MNCVTVMTSRHGTFFTPALSMTACRSLPVALGPRRWLMAAGLLAQGRAWAANASASDEWLSWAALLQSLALLALVSAFFALRRRARLRMTALPTFREAVKPAPISVAPGRSMD